MISQSFEPNKQNEKIAKGAKKAKLRSQRNNIKRNKKRKKRARQLCLHEKIKPPKIKNPLQNVNGKVKALFGKLNLTEIGRMTKFLIRETKITPFIFLYAISMGLHGLSEISLDMLAINMNAIFDTDITGSAFCQRMSQTKSVLFLQSCFESMINLQLEQAFENGFSEKLSMFSEVILEDSTMIELNDRASKDFEGSGGSASKSSLKLNFVFNICRFAAVAVDIFHGNVPDQKNAKLSLKHLKKAALIIRDLGYFSIDSLKKINEKGAYFLSRLKKGVVLYSDENKDIPILDIIAFLKKITACGKSAVVSVYMGKDERLPVQLIAQRVPAWVYRQRIKQYKRKKGGKEPSAEYIALAKYSIFITNVPDEIWRNKSVDHRDSAIAKVIIEVYRIRWQIELLFKKVKSIAKLNIIKGQSKNRILCLVYGKLISLMLGLMVFSFAASQKYKEREVSLWKVATWLVMGNRLAKAVLTGNFRRLYSDFLKDIKLLCKDKRNRRTALERLEESFEYKRQVA